jgi:chemotaxis protein histidine kinase CheA
MIKLLSFDQSYGCRGGARNVPAAVAGPRRVLARQPSEQGPAERMASLFMGRMENIFSAMMNNGASSGGLGMGRGLSAFANNSDLARRMPTIEFGPSGGEQLALPAPMRQMLAPPAYVQPGAAALVDASLQLTVAPFSPQLASPAASADSGLEAGSEMTDMLDMLAARDGVKKTAAKAAAAAAKATAAAAKAAAAAAPAVAQVAAEAAAEPAAIGKAKAQSKAEAKAKAAAKAAATAAAKAAPPAAAKAAPPAPPAAAAKVKAAAAKAPPAPPAAAAKAKAKGKAAAKAAKAVAAVAGDDIKLGCPKCRSALIEVLLHMFSKCSSVFSKCSPNVFQKFSTPNVLQMLSLVQFNQSV